MLTTAKLHEIALRRFTYGTHDTAELAHAAYVKAKRELHAGNTL